MAVVNKVSEYIPHNLGLGQRKESTFSLPIGSYNPEYTFTRNDTTPPYTLTITEKSYSWIKNEYIILKTVIEYDAPWPYGNISKVHAQEEM